MERIVIPLLISTLTSTGLVALWAATSPRHWFMRTAAYLLAISPLLLIPAYEPFIMLVIVGLTIAVGVQAASWLKQRRSRDKRSQSISAPASPRSASVPRFRLSTLLLSTVLVGIAAAIGAQLPDSLQYDWQTTGIVGIAGGVAILLGMGAVTRRGWWKAPALLVSCAAAWIVGLVMPSSDEELFPIAWPPILAGVTALSALAIWFIANWTRLPRRPSWVRPTAAVAALAVTGVVALPAIDTLYRLLTPEPIPSVQLPQPNAFEDLIAAGRLTDGKLVNTGRYDQSVATRNQVAQAVAEVEPAVLLARKSMEEECAVPVTYDSEHTPDLEAIQQLRSLARAFSAVARLAELDGDFDAALAADLDLVQLGVVSRRGGVIVHGMVGAAVTGVGMGHLFEYIDRLNPDQCRETISRLAELAKRIEPYEDVERRDFVWEQHAYGWLGRLYQVLSYASGEQYAGQFRSMFDRELACGRLLTAHLALRAFRSQHARIPESWSEVEADGWPPLGIDPYDPGRNRLRYRRVGDDFVLYSVGQNGIDDGGDAPDENDAAPFGSTGDLRLEDVYGP